MITPIGVEVFRFCPGGSRLPRANQRVVEHSTIEFTKNSPKDSTKG